MVLYLINCLKYQIATAGWILTITEKLIKISSNVDTCGIPI